MEDGIPTLPALVLLTTVATALIGGRLWQRRQKLRALERRAPLNDDAVYSSYYADSGYQRASVLELWAEIAATLKVPAGKLRPTDRFGKEIGSYLITSDKLDILYERARGRAHRLQRDVDFGAILTVDEYVRAFAKR